MNRRSLIKAMLAAPVAGLLSRLPGVDEPEITEAAPLPEEMSFDVDLWARPAIVADERVPENQAWFVSPGKADVFVGTDDGYCRVASVEIRMEYQDIHHFDMFEPVARVLTNREVVLTLDGVGEPGLTCQIPLIGADQHLAFDEGSYRPGDEVDLSEWDRWGVKPICQYNSIKQEDYDEWYRYEVAGYTRDEII